MRPTLPQHGPLADLDAARPHARQRLLARDDPRIRMAVLSSFPVVLVLLWPVVADGTEAWFLGSAAWIALASTLGFLLPWHRLPRWAELAIPLTTIVAVWLVTASAGGFSHGYAMFMLVPLLWLVVYGDPPDIAAGFGVALLCMLAPIRQVLPDMPAQGSLRQHAVLAVIMFVLLAGVRPIIRQLREQVQVTRRALNALHVSQMTLAHDLRNPLSAVRALATLAEHRLETDAQDAREKVAEYASVIRTTTARAERIIEGVLQLSRAGELLPHVEPVDLRELVEEVAAQVEGVTALFEGAPSTVIGHRPSLVSLFRILLDNAAVHAAREDGGGARHVVVRIGGHETPRGWLVTVCDDGPGIDRDEATLLFEPWRRGVGAEGEGSGLGLAIAAAIVEQHGGTIAATNGEPCGAEFTLTLSRRPPVAQEAHVREQSSPDPWVA